MMKNNKFIKVIKTKKYKDINLYLRFAVETTDDMAAKMCLLSKLVGDISKVYPSKVEMAKCRDLLYGISCDCGYKASGNVLTFSIRYSFINPKFVDASIDDYNSFIKETLYNSIIDEKTLKEAKTTIKASLQRKNDKPSYYANERVIEIVSKDNKGFSAYGSGDKFIKQLEKVKLDDLRQTYKDIVNKAQLYIYLCGDVSDEDARKLTTFSFNKRNSVSISNHRVKYKTKKTITDKKDYSQTSLAILYSTPFNKNHKDFFAWFMGNCVLGSGPTSLLFSQIREKMSLCYSITSYLYKNEGLVKISTSIDAKNVELATSAIYKQVDRLIHGNYEPRTLEMCKAYVINTLLSIYDDLDGLVDYYYESAISNFNYSIEEYCQKLNEVTIKDISKVYSKYNHYFDYVLLGTKHE